MKAIETYESSLMFCIEREKTPGIGDFERLPFSTITFASKKKSFVSEEQLYKAIRTAGYRFCVHLDGSDSSVESIHDCYDFAKLMRVKNVGIHETLVCHYGISTDYNSPIISSYIDPTEGEETLEALLFGGKTSPYPLKIRLRGEQLRQAKGITIDKTYEGHAVRLGLWYAKEANQIPQP
ncbi:MAG: hypothetical protein PHQ59_04285 [Candidatus Daviesbacteria bacterium]|nr:hypothetical protein [Candidatus Daviesbacteria bacterium]